MKSLSCLVIQYHEYPARRSGEAARRVSAYVMILEAAITVDVTRMTSQRQINHHLTTCGTTMYGIMMYRLGFAAMKTSATRDHVQFCIILNIKTYMVRYRCSRMIIRCRHHVITVLYCRAQRMVRTLTIL